MFKKSFYLLLIISYLYSNNVGIPNDTCALIVASRKTKADVKAYVDENITNTKYVTLYQSSNGWYAIALGFLKDNEAKSVMKKWKYEGKIPNDSFCTHGNKFVKEVFIDDDISLNVINSYNKKSSNSNKESSNSSNYSDKQLKCLALAWGPDVCSKSFSHYANEKGMDDINDIIKSPICTTMIAKSLREDITQEDLEIAILTGVADEASESGMNSDNPLFQFLGGIAGIYSFGVKAIVYEDCMKK